MTGILSSSTMCGDGVKNAQGDDVGSIEDLKIDTQSGDVRYAVLSFGGFMGMGDKHFAIPFKRLSVDRENKCMILDVDKQKLKDAPGFDKDKWPDLADQKFTSSVDKYYV